ncbi:MAG: tetratricopeptide repeat protein [Myxococcota bacterium]
MKTVHILLMLLAWTLCSACSSTEGTQEKRELGAAPSKLPGPLAKLMEKELEGECMVARGEVCIRQQKCSRGQERDEDAPWCCWEGQTWSTVQGCTGRASSCEEGSTLRGNSCHVEDPVAFYGPLCKRGSSADCYELAQALEQCNDTVCDASRALSLYAENCTERDHLLSCELYALRVRSGTFTRRLSAQGLAALRALCERSGYMACDSYAHAIESSEEDWAYTEAIRLHQAYCDAIPSSASCIESKSLIAKYATTSDERDQATEYIQSQCIEERDAFACIYMAWLTRKDKESKGDYGLYVSLVTEYLGDACFDGDLGACDRLVSSSYSADFDDDLAARALQRLCDAGHGSSCYSLGKLFEHSAMERALNQFIETCEQTQHAWACVRAASSFTRDRASHEELERARELLFPACAQNHLTGCYRLGIVHARLGDLEAAEAPLEIACDAGRYKACAGLGQRHVDTGRIETGRRLLLRACKEKVGATCAALAKGYAGDTFGAPRPKTARKLTERACKHGHATSCYTIAQDYEGGRGVDKSALRALGYYEKACGLGHIPSCDEALARYQTAGSDEDMRSLLELVCRESDYRSCQTLRSRWGLTMTTLL